MSHWRKSHPQTSRFNSLAGWAIGASMLAGALVVFIETRVRLRAVAPIFDWRRNRRSQNEFILLGHVAALIRGPGTVLPDPLPQKVGPCFAPTGSDWCYQKPPPG
jgi:hypothetical protein